MKYTNYLLKKDLVDLEQFKTNKEYLEIFIAPFAIISGFGGVCITGCMLPMTIVYDGMRSIKYQFIKFNRKRIFLN